MASPEPEESWSNHIHTQPHAHTRTHSPRARGELANFSRSQKKKKITVMYNPVSPINANSFPFLQRRIGALKKNVTGFGLAGGGARRARALLLSCAVRSAGPIGPARPPARSLAGPPAVASAAAAAAAAAPWPRPPRAPAASPRRPPASPASAGVGSGPCAASRALSRVLES